MARAHRLETAAGCEVVDRPKCPVPLDVYQSGSRASSSGPDWPACGTPSALVQPNMHRGPGVSNLEEIQLLLTSRKSLL